jgi:signal transduction histidine kinase
VKRRKTLEQAIFDAVEREQKRFASDLHDGVCQELAGVAMMLDAILPRVASDVAVEIRSASEHIRRVTLDARKLALGLAPIAVERAGLAGALALLKLDVETLKGPTVVVSMDEPLARELPLDMAVNLYRIAQEASLRRSIMPPSNRYPAVEAATLLSKVAVNPSEIRTFIASRNASD